MGFAARRAMRAQGSGGSAMVAIGIDLGTSFARVGFWRDGDVTIIPNERGKLATPACVAFTDDCELVGDAALEQADRNLENTITAPQRLIGAKFENPWLQWYMKAWPDKIVRGDDDTPLIKVNYRGRERKMRPEAIVTLFLEHLRKMAEKFLGLTVTEATITVPSRFGKHQRAALAEACRGAKMTVLEMVKAPTAAAVAYVLTNPSQGTRNMLVCDMGASYFNFVLLTADDGGKLKERAIGSDFIDFDSSLVRFCMGEFRERHGKTIANDKLAQHRLRRACEVAKRKLSQYGQTCISVAELHAGIDYEFSLSRGQFEDICSHDIDPMLDPVDYCLEEFGLARSDVHDVVLVGGSARIPRIRRAMREFFYGNTPREVLRPDNAGVLGAAAYAAFLVGRTCGNMPPELTHLELQQATPWTTSPTDASSAGGSTGPGDAAAGGPDASASSSASRRPTRGSVRSGDAAGGGIANVGVKSPLGDKCPVEPGGDAGGGERSINGSPFVDAAPRRDVMTIRGDFVDECCIASKLMTESPPPQVRGVPLGCEDTATLAPYKPGGDDTGCRSNCKETPTASPTPSTRSCQELPTTRSCQELSPSPTTRSCRDTPVSRARNGAAVTGVAMSSRARSDIPSNPLEDNLVADLPCPPSTPALAHREIDFPVNREPSRNNEQVPQASDACSDAGSPLAAAGRVEEGVVMEVTEVLCAAKCEGLQHQQQNLDELTAVPQIQLQVPDGCSEISRPGCEERSPLQSGNTLPAAAALSMPSPLPQERVLGEQLHERELPPQRANGMSTSAATAAALASPSRSVSPPGRGRHDFEAFPNDERTHGPRARGACDEPRTPLTPVTYACRSSTRSSSFGSTSDVAALRARPRIGGASACGGIRRSGGAVNAPRLGGGNDANGGAAAAAHASAATPVQAWPSGFPRLARSQAAVDCAPAATVCASAPGEQQSGGGEGHFFWATCTPRARWNVVIEEDECSKT